MHKKRTRRSPSTATRFKMRLAKLGKTGKTHSLETKKKISESMKKYWHSIIVE